MAEGFGRFWPLEFAHKLRIAIGELQEVQDDLDKALTHSYITVPSHGEMWRLADLAIGASVNLVKYLETAGPDWKKEFRDRMRKQWELGTRGESSTRSDASRKAESENTEPEQGTRNPERGTQGS